MLKILNYILWLCKITYKNTFNNQNKIDEAQQKQLKHTFFNINYRLSIGYVKKRIIFVLA